MARLQSVVHSTQRNGRVIPKNCDHEVVQDGVPEVVGTAIPPFRSPFVWRVTKQLLEY
jgi:hypothetical protein